MLAARPCQSGGGRGGRADDSGGLARLLQNWKDGQSASRSVVLLVGTGHCCSTGLRPAQPPLPVSIIVGLRDNTQTYSSLLRNLDSPTGLRLGRTVDAGFSFLDCASIDERAKALASDVVRDQLTWPSERVAFVGHSMGGLAIRKMAASNSFPQMASATGPRPRVRDRSNDLKVENGNIQSTPHLLSNFLLGLRNQWSLTAAGGKWFAAAGRACSNPTRPAPGVSQGCRSGANSFIDSVVCFDSARVVYPGAGMTPTHTFDDPLSRYQHSTETGYPGGLYVLCPTNFSAFSLTDPPLDEAGTVGLFQQLRSFLNGL